MHVDDGFVVSNDVGLLTSVRRSISSLYDVKWHEEPAEHLGVRITRDRKNRTIHLSQEGYLSDVLERFGMQDSNPVLTPLNPSVSLEPASHLNQHLTKNTCSTRRFLTSKSSAVSTMRLSTPDQISVMRSRHWHSFQTALDPSKSQRLNTSYGL